MAPSIVSPQGMKFKELESVLTETATQLKQARNDPDLTREFKVLYAELRRRRQNAMRGNEAEYLKTFAVDKGLRSILGDRDFDRLTKPETEP